MTLVLGQALHGFILYNDNGRQLELLDWSRRSRIMGPTMVGAVSVDRYAWTHLALSF
jgi:hypothetical protein